MADVIPDSPAALALRLGKVISNPALIGYGICCGGDPAASGYACYLNIVPNNGDIEIGNVNFRLLCRGPLRQPKRSV